MGNGIFWTPHGIAVYHSTLKRRPKRPTRNIVKNTLEDDVTVSKFHKSYTGPIRPGDFLKHHAFVDVATKVYSVGCLEVGAKTEIQVHFVWYNQGFEKSWCINEYGFVSIQVNKLHEWQLCVDPAKDPCLRKCDWIPLAYE